MNAVQAFAALDAEAVQAGLDDPQRFPAGGRLTHSQQIAMIETVAPAPSAMYRGLYALERQAFVGDILTSTLSDGAFDPTGASSLPTTGDLVALDVAALEAARVLLRNPGHVGVVFIPLGFSGLFDPEAGVTYAKLLRGLPQERYNQLGVTVYGTPAGADARAIQWLATNLARTFSYVDLRLTAPRMIPVATREKLVSSLTLALPDASPADRLSMLSAWTKAAAGQDGRSILACVTNVQAAPEVSACAVAKVPFISGPGVSHRLAAPFGGRIKALGDLPVTAV